MLHEKYIETGTARAKGEELVVVRGRGRCQLRVGLFAVYRNFAQGDKFGEQTEEWGRGGGGGKYPPPKYSPAYVLSVLKIIIHRLVLTF